MAFVDDFADVFTDTVILRVVTSRDDFGKPTYGAGTTYNARVVRKHHVVRDSAGDEVVSTAQAWLQGTPAIEPDDQIELSDGTNPPIISVERYQDEVGSSHTKVVLR